MPAADEILISRVIVDSDSRTFDVLVQRYQSRVRGWLRHLSKNSALADDLAQETFLLAWRKLPAYKSKGSFEAWLLTIARNQFLQSVRKTGREALYLDQIKSETRINSNGVDERKYEGAVADAEKLLGILSLDERDVMVLVFAMGCSHSEASIIADLPLGTVLLGLALALPVVPELLHFGRGQLDSALVCMERSHPLQQLRNLIELLPLWEPVHEARQELTQFSQRFRGNSSTQQLLMFLIAGLMILVSILVTRISRN